MVTSGCVHKYMRAPAFLDIDVAVVGDAAERRERGRTIAAAAAGVNPTATTVSIDARGGSHSQ